MTSRVLKVRVDEDYGVAARVLEPGGGGRLVAEVAREANGANAAIHRLDLCNTRAAASPLPSST